MLAECPVKLWKHSDVGCLGITSGSTLDGSKIMSKGMMLFLEVASTMQNPRIDV